MSGTDHHHDHDAHAEIGSGARPGYYDMMETAIRELLVENRLVADSNQAMRAKQNQSLSHNSTSHFWPQVASGQRFGQHFEI